MKYQAKNPAGVGKPSNPYIFGESDQTIAHTIAQTNAANKKQAKSLPGKIMKMASSHVLLFYS
jgi:hypothetical protein